MRECCDYCHTEHEPLKSSACPYCRSKNIGHDKQWEAGGQRWFRFHCRKCGTAGPHMKSLKGAWKAWEKIGGGR